MRYKKVVFIILTLMIFIGGIVLLIVKFRPIKSTYYDIQGKKLADVYYRNKNPTSVYLIEKFYPNGKKKEIAELENSLYEGWRTFFYEDGKIKSKSQYKKDKLNGYAYWYDINGILLQKEFYLNGKNYGSVYFFYADGKLKLYNSNDLLNQTLYVVQYDPDGNIKFHEGKVFSPAVINQDKQTNSYSLFNDSIMVNEEMNLLIAVAEPPNTITKIKIKENKNNVSSISELPIIDCSAIISRKFNRSGKYKFTILGEIRDEKTDKIIRIDSLIKHITVL